MSNYYLDHTCKLHEKSGKFCSPMGSLLLGDCLYTKLLGIVARI